MTSADPFGQTVMAAALLDPTRPGPPDTRFAVHRNNVAAGLTEALAATFPATKDLVGDRFFRAAALEFLRAHPPRSPVLLFWGGAFPEWLSSFPPVANLPWLPDIARIEWARRLAYDAAEAKPLEIAALAPLPPDRLADLRLRLHPSLNVVRSRHPAVSIWADVTGVVEHRPDMSRAEIGLIVRPEATVHVHEVPLPVAAFIEELAAGCSLKCAADVAAALPDCELDTLIASVFELELVTGLCEPVDAISEIE
ncbi:DNA-binding domain-containing protein (plasmid) [Thalassobaculum sp. OXR-137]|uniref:DNA-binding domain-containing protein n=1 Tax=Thalassobaculum sp. OXR-137 TaxID=3100173 RepID=UPI002AC92182|nr:DNA-binding domain-containing protein [Thalassobaculum sp. OXR-137]WPZ37210.1 DNA-binding domain-containing protein [Thalassobaculum sp. OXR-137]